MTDKRGSHLLPLATMLLCLAAVDARAIEFAGASYDGSFDTTLSYGVRSRVEERDTRIIGIPNGGEAFSVNGDDGNRGITSAAWIAYHISDCVVSVEIGSWSIAQ